jgi:hypothetical protein
MSNMTDDRNIKQSMKDNPKYHAEMAKQFIGKMAEKLNKSGVTMADKARIYKKMKGFDVIRKKLESGKGLADRH